MKYYLNYLAYIVFLGFKMYEIRISKKMKFKDGFSSESYYPDSNYYIEQDNTNTPKEAQVSEDQISNMGKNFEWPNTYWFIAERTNGRLAMIGFMAVIINYTLFGWIAYPFL